MSVASEIERIKGNIASAYTAASGKGATMPAVQNSANLAGCIDTITGGGGSSDEWQPNPNWWDIKKILDEDTRDYPGKVGAIMYGFDDVTDFALSPSGMTAVATSDGAFYSWADNGVNVSHNWDTSKDKDDGRGFKTRWVIYYYTGSTTNNVFRQSDIMFGWNYNPIAYLVLRINCSATSQFCYDNHLLEAIENTGYELSGSSFDSFCRGCYCLTKLPENLDTSNSTNFSNFCYNCYSLKELPENLDTSSSTNFSNFCQNCHSLRELPENLDTSNGTNFSSFCRDCHSLKELPENLDTSSSTNFSSFCYNCYSLRELPENLDASNGTNFSSFCYNCHSLKKLPDGLDIRKATTLNSFCYNCYSLKELPENLDTSSSTNFSYFCYSTSRLQDAGEISMSATTTKLTSRMTSPFNSAPCLKNIFLTLPSNTNFWLDSSTRISIESFRYIADHAPDVTATPRTLTVGSTNITRINEADPTIITDLNAKGWTVA